MVQVTARSWIKTIKIDKISDVLSWTSGYKQSLIILFLGKCTLDADTTRHYTKGVRKKLVGTVIFSFPDPFNAFYKMKHNSTITCQN